MKEYNALDTYKLATCEELTMEAYCKLSRVRMLLREIYNDSKCPEQCIALTMAENKILKGLMAIEGIPVDQIAKGITDDD